MASNLINFIVFGIVAGIVIVFILLVARKKPEGKLKKYLTLASASLAGFFVFVLLHNVISGLLSYFLQREIEEPIFFILATIVSPLGLLIGIIGSIIEIRKGREKSR